MPDGSYSMASPTASPARGGTNPTSEPSDGIRRTTSFPEDLSDHDSVFLQKVITELRTALRSKSQKLDEVADEFNSMRASHEELLVKSSNWKDQLEALNARVPQLQAELDAERAARQEGADCIKDLRLRAEESRRAFMRLQAEQDAARKAAKAENRRSMGSASLAGWNPASANGAGPPSIDEDEVKALKHSKRASLAFGPNGTISAGAARSFGLHRRENSGGKPYRRDGSDEDEAAENGARASGMPSSGSARGLRGLSLLGAPTSGSTAGSDDGKSSRRASALSFNASPSSAVSDLPSEDGPLNFASLRRASPPSQQRGSISNSRASGMPTSAESLGLFVPPPNSSRSAGPHSPVPSGSGLSSIGSPIMESHEDGETSLCEVEGDASPKTARSAWPSASTGGMSTLSAMRLEAQLQAKNSEVERLRLEMSSLKGHIQEAQDARRASEACVKALREFIAHGDSAAAAASAKIGSPVEKDGQAPVDLKNVKLPPLPTDADAEEELDERASARPASSWSLRLSTFPGMMRKTTNDSVDSSASKATSSSTDQGPLASTATSLEAAAEIDEDKVSAGGPTSIGSLWSRTVSSVTAAKESASTSASQSKTPNSPPLPASESAGTLTGETPTPSTAAVFASPAASNAFKNIGGWFKKQPAGSEAPPATPQNNVAVPPFASLDLTEPAKTPVNALTPNMLSAAASAREDTTDNTAARAHALAQLQGADVGAFEKA